MMDELIKANGEIVYLLVAIVRSTHLRYGKQVRSYLGPVLTPNLLSTYCYCGSADADASACDSFICHSNALENTIYLAWGI